MSIIRSGCLFLKKSEIDINLINSIKHQLLFKSRILDPITGDMKNIKIHGFYEFDDYLLIPRFAIDLKFSELLNIQTSFYEQVGDSINFNCRIEYRDDIQQQATEFMINNKCGLLCLAPGKGKTMIAIKAISEIKRKTLIIVDQTDICNQWIERFISFTDLTIDDIGVYTKTKKLDKPINIATVQSLLWAVKGGNFNQVRDFFEQFNIGVIIIDEIHAIVGPELFTNVLFYIPSDRIYGLTATPFRTDDRDILIKYWISDNQFVNLESKIQPEILAYYFNGNISSKDAFLINHKVTTNSFVNGKIDWNKTIALFDIHKYYKYLISKGEVGILIANIIIKLFKSNKQILFVCVSKKFINHLFEMILKIDKTLEPHIALFIGDAKRDICDTRIILATMAKCAKAIDIPHIDTLIMGSPVNGKSPELLQVIGRSTREYVDKDGNIKQKAIIIDLIDISMAKTLQRYLSRKEFYISKNYKVIDQENFDGEKYKNIQKKLRY